MSEKKVGKKWNFEKKNDGKKQKRMVFILE
jgi:hypothetical protein